jgi:hypothetical protein
MWRYVIRKWQQQLARAIADGIKQHSHCRHTRAVVALLLLLLLLLLGGGAGNCGVWY